MNGNRFLEVPDSGSNRSSRRPSSVASYISTPDQHLAAQVEVYPKGRKVPLDIEKGERRGFVICRLKVTM